MNENKSNEEKCLKDKEFENMWEYQQGSLMLKNENSSLDWKKSIARYFYDFGRKAAEEECLQQLKISTLLDKELGKRDEEVSQLKAELDQQRFNNKHNISIDQKISDEIEKLKAENERLKEVLSTYKGDETDKLVVSKGWLSEQEKENQKLKDLVDRAKPIIDAYEPHYSAPNEHYDEVEQWLKEASEVVK